MERAGRGEIRVRVSGDIRISGDLRALFFPRDAQAGGRDGEERPAAAQEFLTVEQVAEILHVSRDRVYSLLRTGELRSIKIGKLRRISRQWITEFASRPDRGSAGR